MLDFKPKCGIRTKPPKIEPKIEPRVFVAYKLLLPNLYSSETLASLVVTSSTKIG